MFTRCDMIPEIGYFMHKEQSERCLLFSNNCMAKFMVSSVPHQR